jgi:hypothetical protein
MHVLAHVPMPHITKSSAGATRAAAAMPNLHCRMAMQVKNTPEVSGFAEAV